MSKEWEAAIRCGDLERVRGLLQSGADINAKDRYGQTGIMIASRRGYPEVVRLLAKCGAELNTIAKYQLSALMLAVLNGHAEIVKILAEAGARRDIRGTGAPGFWNKTALDLAENAGRHEIAGILRNTPAAGGQENDA